MGRALALCGALCLATLLACSEDQVFCAPLPAWAVAVDVRDSVTNVPVVSGARGAVFLAGALDDSLRPERLLHLFPDTVLVGGMSVGRVEVRIEHVGYRPWTATDVQTRLSQGECPDWETHELTARLQAEAE